MNKVLSHFKSTINDEQIIGASSIDALHTWIDAAYVVHPNMRDMPMDRRLLDMVYYVPC